MQLPVKQHVQNLRLEIAQIANANRKYVNSNYKHALAVTEQAGRLQRLQEIMDELRTLYWKET
jgi:hypothetical protein